MERFFSSEKIVFTGNPIRKNILDYANQKKEAQRLFEIDISNIKDICIDVDSLGISSYPEEKEIILPGGLHFNIDNMDDTIHTSPNGKTYRKR